MKAFTTKEICKRMLDEKRKVITQEHINQLQLATKNLPDDWTVNRKAWHYLYPDYKIPKCKICDNDVIFLKKRYWEWCSNSCLNLDPEKLNKRISTSMERYGVANPLQSADIDAKRRETNLKKYGVEHPLQNTEVLKKLENTVFDRYGVTNVNALDETKEKIRNAHFSKNK